MSALGEATHVCHYGPQPSWQEAPGYLMWCAVYAACHTKTVLHRAAGHRCSCILGLLYCMYVHFGAGCLLSLSLRKTEKDTDAISHWHLSDSTVLNSKARFREADAFLCFLQSYHIKLTTKLWPKAHSSLSQSFFSCNNTLFDLFSPSGALIFLQSNLIGGKNVFSCL